MGPKSNKNSSQSVTDPCICCRKNVDDHDKALECDQCKLWVHAKCAGWTEDAYKAVKQQPGFRFFCTVCLPTIDALRSLSQEICTIKEELSNVNQEVSSIKDEFSTIMAQFEVRLHRIETTMACSAAASTPRSMDRLSKLETIVQKLSSTKPSMPVGLDFRLRPPTTVAREFISQPINAFSSELHEKIKDDLERDSKRKNAVLFGLPVSDENETCAVRSMVNEANLDNLKSDDIVTCFRHGPTYEGKPRFCKVYCKSVEAKQAFITFVNNSRKNGDEEYREMRARPDLSFLQRRKARELRAELTSRTANGESDLYIDYKTESIKKRRRVIWNVKPTQKSQPLPENQQNDQTSISNSLSDGKAYQSHLVFLQ